MIDKSIRQHYQNGERVDPYRKGLELIAGKGKDTFQTTAPAKITAKSLFQPTGKMTFPSMKKDKAVPPIATLPRIAHPSLDSARYSGLLNILPKTEEGSYLDKYINRKPIRIVERAAEAKPTVEDTAAMEDIGIDPHYLTSSLVGTDKATTSLDINKILAQLTASPKTDTAATFTDKGETATSYTDTQVQDIIKNANPNEKNFITTIVKTANDTIENLDDTLEHFGLDKTKIATNLVTKKVGDVVATKLGISGGAAGGPVGMIIGGIIGWLVNKVMGGKKEETGETPKGAISLADKDSTDKEFKVSGTYGGNEVYSSDGSSVDSKTGDITNVDGSHGGNIVDEFPSEPSKSAPVKAPVVAVHVPHQHRGGNGNQGNQGSQSHRGGAPSHSTRDLMSKGGRVDKALGGRSRDI